MNHLPPELLTRDAAALLENTDFRAWAVRTELPTPAGYPEVAAARAILLGARRDEPVVLPAAEEKAADFAALMQRIEAEPAVKPAKPTVIRRLVPAFAAAAAVLLLVATALLLWPNGETETLYTTGNGELKTVELPDGTTVTLHANSTLTLTAGEWEAQDRSVTLTGEAFFDVTRQSGANGAKAFLVKTDDLTVRVLGTRFDVRERGASSRVYLEEGKVDVHWQTAGRPVTELAPGEVVERASASAPPVSRPVRAAERYASWTGGHLTFVAVPLREALAELETIYGITFAEVDTRLLTKELTSAGIPVNNQALAVQLLEKALGLRIERQDARTFSVLAAE